MEGKSVDQRASNERWALVFFPANLTNHLSSMMHIECFNLHFSDRRIWPSKPTSEQQSWDLSRWAGSNSYAGQQTYFGFFSPWFSLLLFKGSVMKWRSIKRGSSRDTQSNERLPIVKAHSSRYFSMTALTPPSAAAATSYWVVTTIVLAVYVRADHIVHSHFSISLFATLEWSDNGQENGQSSGTIFYHQTERGRGRQFWGETKARDTLLRKWLLFFMLHSLSSTVFFSYNLLLKGHNWKEVSRQRYFSLLAAL